MGTDGKQVTVIAVGSQTEPWKERDDRLWADLMRRVREIVDEPEYAYICALVV